MPAWLNRSRVGADRHHGDWVRRLFRRIIEAPRDSRLDLLGDHLRDYGRLPDECRACQRSRYASFFPPATLSGVADALTASAASARLVA